MLCFRGFCPIVCFTHSHARTSFELLSTGGEDKNTIFGEMLVFDVVTNAYQTLPMPSGAVLPRERKQHITFSRCRFVHFFRNSQSSSPHRQNSSRSHS